MENLIATAIGAAIDRQDGDSGIRGAIIGYVAASVVTSAIRLSVLGLIGYGAFRLVRQTVRQRA